MTTFAVVFLGGGLGATLRWALSLGVRSFQAPIWLGTFIANVLGCLVFFSLYKVIGQNKIYAPFIITGFCGALTTFSTYIFDISKLIEQQKLSEAALVLFLNLFFGLILAYFLLRK